MPWCIYIIILTPGSELGGLALNGPCVSYSNLGRTAMTSVELRNPQLNWVFFKVVFLIGPNACGKKCKYKQ